VGNYKPDIPYSFRGNRQTVFIEADFEFPAFEGAGRNRLEGFGWREPVALEGELVRYKTNDIFGVQFHAGVDSLEAAERISGLRSIL
jgi:hypothetical protein